MIDKRWEMMLKGGESRMWTRCPASMGHDVWRQEETENNVREWDMSSGVDREVTG